MCFILSIGWTWISARKPWLSLCYGFPSDAWTFFSVIKSVVTWLYLKTHKHGFCIMSPSPPFSPSVFSSLSAMFFCFWTETYGCWLFFKKTVCAPDVGTSLSSSISSDGMVWHSSATMSWQCGWCNSHGGNAKNKCNLKRKGGKVSWDESDDWHTQNRGKHKLSCSIVIDERGA